MNRKSVLNYCIIILFLSILIQCSNTPNLTKQELADPNKIMVKAREAYADKRYTLAINTFSIILKKYPNDTYNASWAQYEIGMCYYMKEDYKKARDSFVIVLQKYPIPRQPRILSLHLIRKIDSNDGVKRTTYKDE